MSGAATKMTNVVKEKLLIPIYPIPVDKVDPPFDEMISMLQKADIEVPGALDEVTQFLVTHCLNVWETALHWVTKLKWNTKHEIPGGQEYVRALKPMGQALAHEMELCIRCHAGVGYKAAGYLDASHWFSELFMEHQRLDLDESLTVTDDGGGKTAIIAGFRQNILAVLEEDQNPFDPAIEPHMHKLIDCSLRLVARSDVFRKKYWAPYKRSLRAWITQVDQEGCYQLLMLRVVGKKERAFLQICKPLGRGKGRRILLEKEVKKEVVSETLTA